MCAENVAHLKCKKIESQVAGSWIKKIVGRHTCAIEPVLRNIMICKYLCSCHVLIPGIPQDILFTLLLEKMCPAESLLSRTLFRIRLAVSRWRGKRRKVNSGWSQGKMNSKLSGVPWHSTLKKRKRKILMFNIILIIEIPSVPIRTTEIIKKNVGRHQGQILMSREGTWTLLRCGWQAAFWCSSTSQISQLELEFGSNNLKSTKMGGGALGLF